MCCVFSGPCFFYHYYHYSYYYYHYPWLPTHQFEDSIPYVPDGRDTYLPSDGGDTYDSASSPVVPPGRHQPVPPSLLPPHRTDTDAQDNVADNTISDSDSQAGTGHGLGHDSDKLGGSSSTHLTPPAGPGLMLLLSLLLPFFLGLTSSYSALPSSSTLFATL